MKVSVIIVAAGYGKRMGGSISKQLLELNGRPVLYYCIKAFNKIEEIDEIIVVVNRKIFGSVKSLIIKSKFKKAKELVIGGKERQYSVYNGLKKLKCHLNQIVLIHDGVRPLVTKKIILDVIRNSKKFGSAIPALPVKETLKMSEDGDFFLKTINRNKIWSIQTPQGFKYNILIQAFEKARKDNFIGSDDAALIERIGVKPKIVPGSFKNIKITTPEDVKIAKKFMKKN
jgi:2-C-methyl-D-erythritol 4-phosphate cytidylyltransferase